MFIIEKTSVSPRWGRADETYRKVLVNNDGLPHEPYGPLGIAAKPDRSDVL